MGVSLNMDDERRRQAKEKADSLIQAGRITTDAELDAFMAAEGVKPLAPADGTARQDPSTFQDFGAKYGGARQLNPLEGIGRSAASGATLGVSERAVAAGRSLLGGIPYDSARTLGTNEMGRFRAENPLTALTSELVGGGPKAAPSNMLARSAVKGMQRVLPGTGAVRSAVRGGVTGAATGAAAGVGYQDGAADKSLEQTIANALFGAKVGGGLGAVAGVAPKIGGAAADLTNTRLRGDRLAKGEVPVLPGEGTANPLTREFWSGDNARRLAQRGEGLLFPTQAGRRTDQKWAELLTNSGRTTLDDARRELGMLDGLTGNAMVLDIGGDRGLRAMRGARGIGEQASGTLNEALGARRATLSSDMQDDVNALIAQRENVPQGVEARRQVRSDNARAAYAPVMQDEVTLSDDVKEFMLNDPQGLYEQAWTAGATTRLREDPKRNLARLFGKEDPPTLSPILGEDGAPVNAVEVASAPPPRRKVMRPVTVEDVDMMKKGMDVVVGNRAESQSANMRYDSRLIRQQLDRLLKDADASSKGYAAARKRFGDDSEVMEAFQAGAEGINTPFRQIPSFRNATPDQVEDFVSKLSDAGKQEYKAGLAQDMYRMVDDNATAALGKVAAPTRAGTRRKVDAAFADDPEAGKALQARWTARDAQHKNAAFIEGGSPTAEKLIDQIEAASLPGRIGQLTYAPGRGLAALLGQKAINSLQKRMADELATRGTLQGPLAQEYITYLERLLERQGQRATNRAAMTARGIGTGVGARDAFSALFGGGDR